eukprot:1941482-Prymnesium_polylepis.2
MAGQQRGFGKERQGGREALSQATRWAQQSPSRFSRGSAAIECDERGARISSRTTGNASRSRAAARGECDRKRPSYVARGSESSAAAEACVRRQNCG